MDEEMRRTEGGRNLSTRKVVVIVAGLFFRPSVIDLATEATDCLTAPQRSYSYSMTNARGRVANFILYKKAFKLGEDVVGRFIFDGCPSPCLQVFPLFPIALNRT
uniref:Uncharacterized protein n=1 Tax=Parascaris equorum TaxID=6256 RepID=A0A914RAS0_PAREQ